MNSRINFYEKYTSTSMLIGQDESELTRWSIGYFSKFIIPFLPHQKNINILEIGCGYGRNILALNQNGYNNVVGIDISDEQINYARQNLNLENVFVGDALSFLEDKNSSFDVILLLDVLEHLNVDYSITLIKRTREVLKENGILIIQVPNALSPLSVNRHGDITHQRAYTTHSMEQSLRLGGFNKFDHFELPPYVHGILSFFRRMLWNILVKPLISIYMLIVNSNRMGGIYTPNMLTVAFKNQPISFINH